MLPLLDTTYLGHRSMLECFNNGLPKNRLIHTDVFSEWQCVEPHLKCHHVLTWLRPTKKTVIQILPTSSDGRRPNFLWPSQWDQGALKNESIMTTLLLYSTKTLPHMDRVDSIWILQCIISLFNKSYDHSTISYFCVQH